MAFSIFLKQVNIIAMVFKINATKFPDKWVFAWV